MLRVPLAATPWEAVLCESSISKPCDSAISEVRDGCYSQLTEKPKQQGHSQLHHDQNAVRNVCLFRMQVLQLGALADGPRALMHRQAACCSRQQQPHEEGLST